MSLPGWWQKYKAKDLHPQRVQAPEGQMDTETKIRLGFNINVLELKANLGEQKKKI